MKAINIIGMIMTIALIFLSVYYVNEVHDARWSAMWNDFSYGYDSYNSYSSYGSSASDLTLEGGLFTLVLVLFFNFMCIMNLVKVKTSTSKVMGIIGVSISGLCLLLNLLMLGDPGGASYDEVGPIFVIYAFVMMAFAIVFLVQSVKASSSAIVQPKIDEIV